MATIFREPLIANPPPGPRRSVVLLTWLSLALTSGPLLGLPPGPAFEVSGPDYRDKLHVGTFSCSFPLPLQSNLLPLLRGDYRRTELPPPAPRPISLRFFQNGSLPLIGLSELPVRRTWPHPTGPLPLNLSYARSFPLPLTTVRPPFIQRDWAGTPKTKKSVAGYTQNALTFATIIATTPFVQDDWPVPRGATPSISLRTWTASLSLPTTALGHAGFITGPSYLQPIPVGFTQNALTFATFVNTAPPSQRFWPLPVPRIDKRQDWVTGVPYALANTVVVVTKIERTYDWRNPQGARRKPIVADFQNRNQLLLSSVAPLQPIAGQKTIRRSLGVSTTGPNLVLTLLSGKDVLPRNNYDWPIPRGRIPSVSLKTFIGRISLTLQAINPPSTQRDWPNPRAPQRGNQFWIPSPNLALELTTPEVVAALNPGACIVGGYFSRGQWHTIIGTPCPPKKRRSWREPGFSFQQYQDLKEAIQRGEGPPPSQRKVKRWFESGAFTRAQFDDIKATIRLEQETKAQQEKLAAEAQAFAEARAHEDRLGAIEAEAQAAQAQNEIQARAGQLEAASKLQALQSHLRLGEAMAAAARRAKAEDEDDEKAIAMLFGDD